MNCNFLSPIYLKNKIRIVASLFLSICEKSEEGKKKNICRKHSEELAYLPVYVERYLCSKQYFVYNQLKENNEIISKIRISPTNFYLCIWNFKKKIETTKF